MATNDVWQLTVKGFVHGSDHIHTLHFLEVAGPLLGTDLLTSYTGAPLTAYRALFAPAATPVQQIEARKVCGAVPLPAPSIHVPASGSQVGTRSGMSGQMVASYEAALVNEKGSLAGRRYSGRFFIGGLYQSDTYGNDIQSAYLTLLDGYLAALRTAYMLPSGGLAWRLFAFSSLLANGDPLHTRRNPVPGGARIADPVTAVSCEQAGSFVMQLVASTRATTMRSRKLGHGN
jgi:hypothetical protein